MTHHTEEDRKKNQNTKITSDRKAEDASAPNPDPKNPSNLANLEVNNQGDNSRPHQVQARNVGEQHKPGEVASPGRVEEDASQRNPDFDEARKQDQQSAKEGKISADRAKRDTAAEAQEQAEEESAKSRKSAK